MYITSCVNPFPETAKISKSFWNDSTVNTNTRIYTSKSNDNRLIYNNTSNDNRLIYDNTSTDNIKLFTRNKIDSIYNNEKILKYKNYNFNCIYTNNEKTKKTKKSYRTRR